MQIPFVDLKQQYQHLSSELLPAIENIMQEGRFILGQEVAEFEQQFAAYCQTKHAIGVASGTEALHLALRALEIGPGDEVITAGNTFIATALAVAYAGAEPVFVDVSDDDYNIEPTLIEQAITPRTKAIIPIHLYGQPAKMGMLLEIAKQHGLYVVEDACQAHGARYEGRRVGSLGDIGCFSFYPGKNLGAYGDGGAIVTDDDTIAERLQWLRNYGQREKNVHSMLGFNSRLDTVQAAVLLAKLKHLDHWNDNRRRIAAQYDAALCDAGVLLPTVREDAEHVYHLYVIRTNRRDELRDHLSRHGVACGIHYPHPLTDAVPFRKSSATPAGVPVCSRLAREILSLPMFPEMTSDQAQYVAECIAYFAAGHQPVATTVEIGN